MMEIYADTPFLSILTGDMSAYVSSDESITSICFRPSSSVMRFSSAGSFLTFAYETKLPVSFCTDGQLVPDDLKQASTLVLMQYLKGLNAGIKPVLGQLT